MDEYARDAIWRAKLCAIAGPTKSGLSRNKFGPKQRVPSSQAFVIGAPTRGSKVNGRLTVMPNFSDPFGIDLSRALASANNRARSAVAKSIASPVTSQANPVRSARSFFQGRSRVDAFILISPTILEPIADSTIRAADPTPPRSRQLALGYILGVE
jgi:hypothetical protein